MTPWLHLFNHRRPMHSMLDHQPPIRATPTCQSIGPDNITDFRYPRTISFVTSSRSISQGVAATIIFWINESRP